MKLIGARIIWESLLREGVDVVFGIPGGRIILTYHVLPEYPIRHILMRHEQAAAHAADGYARATGKVGVCFATSGPGATNLVTGIAAASMDSSPIVAITGQVGTDVIGKDAFQETDITGITLPITKHNYLVTDVRDLAGVIKEAFHIARTGRPGPVLIDVPRDVQATETEFEYPKEVNLPGYRPTLEGNVRQIRQAARLINEAERPVIVAGHGIILSGAQAELQELAVKTQTPVVTTLLGISCVSESHSLCLGMLGMHGEVCANMAVQDADLVIAIGMRFDDRVTSDIPSFAPKARIVHIDIDPSEIGKNVRVDVPIVGDARNVLRELNKLVEPADRREWLERIESWRAESCAGDILFQEQEKLVAPYVIQQICEIGGKDAIVVSDVGQNQMWEAQYWCHDKLNSLISSGGLGTMGFALPASIGVKVGRPQETVWVIAGDGGFQMTIQELATLVQDDIAVKIAIINNGYLGMVRQWQEFFFERRYSATRITGPDFVKIAEAYGIPGFCVTERSQVAPAIEQAMAYSGPALIDFRVEPEENVYPMVCPGAPISEMLRRPIQTKEVSDL